MFSWTPSCILTMTQCSQSCTVTFKLNVCIACRRCWCAFVRDSGHRLVWTCSWQRVSSVSWLAYRRQFIWALRNGLKLLLPPHSSGVEKRVRRSQIAGWLTGVDRHIALTSVKKLTRANRWLSPAVQLFPSADTDCCACKKSEVWEISIFVEAVTAVSCWCSTKETASKRRHFSLYPSKCGIHVSSNTSTVLWKGLRIAAMSSRETRIAFVQRSRKRIRRRKFQKFKITWYPVLAGDVGERHFR